MIVCDMNSLNILELKLDVQDEQDVDRLVLEAVNANDKIWIGNLNAHAFNLLCTDKEFRCNARLAKANFIDGKGFLLILKLLFPFRLQFKQVTYNRWFSGFLSRSSSLGATFYFLGDEPSIIEKAMQKCNVENHSCLGAHHGYFSSETEDDVISEINRSKAKVLVVGMGMPRQEALIARNCDRLNCNVILNGGACFKFYTDSVSTCPSWMSNSGFEWMYRLLREPKRLWRRYVIGNPLAIIRLLKLRLDGTLKIDE